MPRPPAAKPGEPTKTFIVRPGFIIGDNDNVKRIGKGTLPNKEDIPNNDLIELTFEQAKYFRAMEAIEVPLEDFSNETTTLAEPQGSASQEASGDQAERSGEPDLGASSSDPFAQATRKNNG